MRLRKILPLSLLALLIATSTAASAATLRTQKDKSKPASSDAISGWYEGAAKSSAEDKGGIPVTFEIKNDNGKLSGNLEAPQGQLKFIGTYRGNQVILKFNPGAEITVTATFKGDEIIGTWDMEGVKGFFEIKKISRELVELKARIRQAQNETLQFIQAGGKPSDENHPGKKWAASLFQYADQHPSTQLAERATTEALLLLVRSEQIAQAALQSYAIKPDGSLWEQVVKDALETANHDEFNFIFNNTEALIANSKDKELQSLILFRSGMANWRKGHNEKAKALFQQIIKDYPATTYVEFAKGNIYEFEQLNVGQRAPAFAATLTNGKPVSLADLKGKPVLLVYWASW